MSDRQREPRDSHDYFRMLAAAAVDGRLDPDSAAELEAHLATCASCRADHAAMLADHAWLAAPAAAILPRAEVRAFVLQAARAPRVPRVGTAPRPWSALAAAAVVIAFIGGGIILATRFRVPGAGTSTASPSTTLPPELSSIPPGVPYGRAERVRLVGNSPGAAPEIFVTAIVVGGSTGTPQGYVEFSDPTGESWAGSITMASYHHDLGGQWRVARIEGCKGGGVPPCELYALQLIDGRERPDQQDEISLSFPNIGAFEPDPWDYWYRTVAGDIFVDGPMDDCCAATPAASPAEPSNDQATCRTIPEGLTARWTFDEPHERLSDSPLTLVGDASFALGISGSALRLSGSTSEARAADTSIGQLSTDDFTVSVWVRFMHTAGEQVLVERFRAGNPTFGWTMTKLASGEIRLAIATDLDSFAVDTTGADLTPEVWHHVAARRLDRTFSLFVDGRLAGSARLPDGERANLSVLLPLLFGRRGDDRGFHLDGDLDEVLIWSSRGLSDAELTDVRTAGTRGFCEAAAGAGYQGEYQATDCAASGATLDCARWGDSSRLHLTIGPGEEPIATFEDSAVEGCGPGGAAGPRSAEGIGRFDGAHLWVTFSEVSCSAPDESWKNPLQLYKSMNDARLWFDPDGDGWGTTWERV